MREKLEVLAVTDALEPTNLVVAELAASDHSPHGPGRDIEAPCDGIEIVQLVVDRGGTKLVNIHPRAPWSLTALTPKPHALLGEPGSPRAA